MNSWGIDFQAAAAPELSLVDLSPQRFGVPGYVWQCLEIAFCCHTWGGECQWHLVGKGLLTTLQWWAVPAANKYLAPNVRSVRLGNPALQYVSLLDY